MMWGTLEEKKENLLADNLEREEWMNKPIEEMTEDEKVKLREFEVNVAKMAEEKEKHKKNLGKLLSYNCYKKPFLNF